MSDTAKPSSQLLSAIQSADTKVVLKDVTTVENPAAKHDMAMVGTYLILWLILVCGLLSYKVRVNILMGMDRE